MKRSGSSLKGRVILTLLVGAFFMVVMSISRPFPSLLSLFILIGSIIMAAAAWFSKAFFDDQTLYHHLFIGSICALTASILFMIINGPGQTYYYKIIYPVGESPVQTGTTGSAFGYIGLAGIAGIIYYGWIQLSARGWSIVKYGALVFGGLIGICLVIALVASIRLSMLPNPVKAESVSSGEKSESVPLAAQVTEVKQTVIQFPECDGASKLGNTYLCIMTNGTNRATGDTPDFQTQVSKAEYRHENGNPGMEEVKLEFKDYTLSFQPAQNTPWKTGLYEGAKDYRYWQEPYNGFNIEVQSTVYGSGTGRFQILEFQATDQDELERFAANFEFKTDSGASFSGYVRYNSTIP